MPRTIRLVCVLFLLALVLTATQSGFAQSVNGPLNFGNNYFVTGDYVVAGAQEMNENFANGYAVGTISIPDPNPGITGAKFVPAGAEVIAAVLYWQTVEKVGTNPGQPGSGQNGFFRPLIIGGPKAPGYPLTGVSLASNDTVSFSSGGCTGTSTGKLVRTYRANVIGALPRDPTGNISANGLYEVRLPSVGNNTPLTLGATLVLIYRIISPSVPLNSIVIYDGGYAPSTGALTMKQTVQGFYDAAHAPVSRLTHIVGQGKGNKLETVYLNNTQLPSLYGQEPAFPGFYGTWDNPTWTLNSNETYVRVANPIGEDAASASTEVVPHSSQQGCVSWGAVIVSTTVKNSDNDGLLDAWKKTPVGYANPGYCDASVNEGVCTPGSSSWVDLPQAVLGEKDVFVQLDYMCSKVNPDGSCPTGDGTNYSFDPPPGAVAAVTSAFTANPKVHTPVHLHINPPGTNQPNVHAIPEPPMCADVLPALCTFPYPPGVVAWKEGFVFFKNQLVDPDDSSVTDCAATPPAVNEPDCVPRFQPGKRHSWHYVLFAHAVGGLKWKLQDDSLESVTQSGNTVTFTTSAPVGTLNSIGKDYNNTNIPDPTCSFGRITIIGAATNPNLDGTFCVLSSASNSFTITVGGNPTAASYTYLTDPNLAVAPGFTSSQSGVSDVGGADSLVTLGLWGNPASPASDGQQPSVLAGTFMHELGHSNGLTHGGFTYPLAPLGIYVPLVQPNCKPNHQSVMNYLFQVDLLHPINGGANVPDYSGQVLASLNKGKAGVANVFSSPSPSYLNTSWYTPPSGVGTPTMIHCDGSTNTNGASMTLSPGAANTLSWAAGQDINFDGNTTETLQGFNDWAHLDLRQIGATGSNSTAAGGINLGGGGINLGGGGINLGGGGINLGGGGINLGGGGINLGGGGINLGGGGINLGGGGEVDVATVNSFTRPPQQATASEAASPRKIMQNWLPPTFGQIGDYNVYRAVKGQAFGRIAIVMGNPPATTYTDTVSCNPLGYEYFVTAVLSNTSASPGQESVGSNTVSVGSGPGNDGGLLTGCYTVTGFSSPASGTQGTVVPITWNLADDFNTTGAPVTNGAANTLVAIGPAPATTRIPLVTAGVVVASGSSSFGGSGGQFTFNWDTDGYAAGSYTFELDLDSQQAFTTASPLQLGIDVTDSDTPQIITVSLTNGVVGQPYSNTLSEHGGTGPIFTWGVVSGALPSGITLSPAGTLSGTSCVAGPYGFTAQVTDSATPKNTGSRALTLQIVKADTTTSVASNANPSVFGQPVTFTVTVAPQSPCTPPTGTVNLLDNGVTIATSLPLINGMATFMTSSLSVAGHPITATYSGDANFNATYSDTGSTANTLTQTVNKADTATSVMSSLSPSTYGQAVTFTATVSPVSPGAGTPTGMVIFEDAGSPLAGSSTVSLSAGTASFTTTATQLMAGPHSIIAVYSGDADFNKTGFDGASMANPLVQTVNPRLLTVSATGVNKVYDGTTAATVVLSGNPVPADVLMYSYASANFVSANAGTDITLNVGGILAMGSAVTNYTFNTTTNTTANIIPAPLTAIVTGSESTDGPPPTTFTVASVTYSGFVNGENSASANVAGTPSCSVSATPDSATHYPISCSGLSAPNYGINYSFSVAATLTYTQLQPATSSPSTTQPGPRCCAAMAFDQISNSTLLFGGVQTFDNVNYTTVNDTWQFQSGQWTQLTPSTGSPSPRSGAAMVYDPATKTIVLFGGTSAAGDLNDTWIWDGSTGTWTQAIPNGAAGSPPARRFDAQGMAYDSATQTVVMFGGFAHDYVAQTDTPLGDTWTWDGSNWTQQSPASSPSARRTVLATDALGNVLLFGGSDGTNNLADTWVWSGGTGATWTQQSPATSPPARNLNEMVFNPVLNKIVLFGGAGAIGYNDTWTWDGNHWNPVALANPQPPQRYAFGMDYDGAAKAMVLFGGYTTSGPAINDTWEVANISPAPLTVTVSGTLPSGSSTAAPLAANSVTYFGFVNGDTASVVTGTLSCTVDTTSGPPYPMPTCTGLSAPNTYTTITYALGTVTVK